MRSPWGALTTAFTSAEPAGTCSHAAHKMHTDQEDEQLTYARAQPGMHVPDSE
jgi:hypothetical protein